MLGGWEPKVTLEEGLQKTVQYFRGKVQRAGQSSQGSKKA